MLANEPQLVADVPCVCGENPLWHPTHRRLYWVDIPRGTLFSYDPATGAHEPCLQTDPIGGFTIQEDGRLLLFMAGGAVKLWDGSALVTVIEQIPGETDTRFNDVIADPRGRVFAGTMSTPDRPGRLYRIETDGSYEVIIQPVGCSNGLGFTPDRHRVYYTDSIPREIALLDYDQATGELTNRRLFASLSQSEGLPDGLTVDAEGFIWSARWEGGCVVRYAPDGSVDCRIDLPTPKVTSVIFAGEAYEDLYVTTAGGDERGADDPLAGALFCFRPDVRGVPEFPSRVAV